MVAALTPLPVVGVPVKPAGAHLDGLDALLSIVQVESHPSAILKSQSWVPDSSPDAWTPKASMPEFSEKVRPVSKLCNYQHWQTLGD